MRSPAKTKRSDRQPVSIRKQYTPPFRGLNTRDPEAVMSPGYATGLINWWPSGAQIGMRYGSLDYATNLPAPVKALASWESPGGTRKLFAFTDSGIYDVTSEGPVGAAAHARTSGAASYVAFRNSANTFLMAVNGVDQLTYYNGTVWTNVPTFALSAGSINTQDLVAMEVHQRRLWFVAKESTDAYYLGVDLIGGTATLFPLGAQFSKGGKLLAISTWSVDGGAGPEDYCAFISSLGQVAVYTGLDPNDTTSWKLKGVFNLPEPIGRRCVAKVGKDCLIITRAGVFALATVLTGQAELEQLAITDAIRTSVVAASDTHFEKVGWQLYAYPSASMLLLNVPTTEYSRGYQFAMNTVSKAWTIFAGWDALCWEQHGANLFFGTSNKVVRAWVGRNDNGLDIKALARGHFDALQAPTVEKQWRLVRPTVKFRGQVTLSLGLDVDYNVDLAYGTAPRDTNFAYQWDDPTSDWGVAKWAGLQTNLSDWLEYPAWPGSVVAVRLRAVSKTGTVSWSATDFIFEPGAIF